MSKKLSEIGTTASEKVLLNTETVVVRARHSYTDAERQDLVRQVFEYAWEEGQCHPNSGVEAELAKFLKEHGL